MSCLSAWGAGSVVDALGAFGTEAEVQPQVPPCSRAPRPALFPHPISLAAGLCWAARGGGDPAQGSGCRSTELSCGPGQVPAAERGAGLWLPQLEP